MALGPLNMQYENKDGSKTKDKRTAAKVEI